MNDQDKTKEELLQELQKLKQENEDLRKLRIKDIAERKKVEEIASGLSSIIEHSLNEIYVFDITTLKFVYVNKCALNNLGFSNEEIIALTPVDIKPGFTLDIFLIAINPILSGEEDIINFETIHQRKDGSTYPVEVYLQLSNFEGKQVFVAIILDISKHKLTDETLLKIETLNKILVEHLPQKIFIKDENSNYLICNKNYATDLGIASVEIAGKNDYDFYPVNLADDYRKDDKEVLQNGIIKDIEEKYILNEKEMWVHTIKVPLRNKKNEVFGVLGIFEDITDRKQAEEALNKERQRFKQILDNFPFGIYIVDRDCRIEYMNLVLSQEFGDPGTHKCYEYFHDLHESCSWCQNREVFKGKIVNWEWHSPRNNRDFHLVDIPLHNADGSVSKLEIFQDITERKQTEKKMAISLEQERFMANLIRNASVAIGVGYPDGSLGLCNLAFQKLTGYSEEELKSIAWNSVLTPPEWLESEIQSLAKLHLTKQSIIYQKEYIHKSGNRVPIELVVHPFYDVNGNITHYYAFITDITERKKAEVELRKLNKAVETAGEVVFMTNIEGIFTYINPAFTVVYGYEASEVVAKTTPRILKSGLMDESFYQYFWQTLKEHQIVSGELINRNKDGSKIFIWNSSSAILNEYGEVEGYLAIQRDITSYKEEEKKTIKAMERALESDRLKTAFLNNLSHEIRTPMNSIMGFASLLPEEDSKELIANYANYFTIPVNSI